MKTINTSRGFTLIELLVAIGILAMVAVLGWRGLDGIVRTRAALTAQMETTRGMQLAFAQMQSDCEHLVAAEDLRGRPYLVADATRMVLVRRVLNEFEPSRLQVVTYRVVNGVLTRSESQSTRDLVQLDVFWKAAVAEGQGDPGIPLQAGVNGMMVQVFESGAWHPATAPTAGAAQMLQNAPDGLQVALQVQGLENPMSKVFLLRAV
ncbi:prepilin-type N-terminal cleavage/methylation domain-containing protein [Massilia arenosa]|uniref:Prepilin-type N-terminal cleavage/methylation domain-containing protein n=1 Tax=Zemynaea arenosa TaxID=2561931 RepID=A0A4Y9SF90_9BURK|nr:prepilin-type N-terminal cleavage/methylation domain-containing protein [Massilia arenosa]TFW22150.1 prepilin-type N-terminal cleavage/methylation domain-containing protein [Massilia arenosa]